MVKINNKEFTIYNLDSEQTIYERIAANMNTLPKFLIFPAEIPTIVDFSIDQNIDVHNLIDVIKNGTDITSVYKEIKTYENETIGTFTLKDIVNYYTILNLNFIKTYDQLTSTGFENFGISTIERDIKNISDENNNITYDELEMIWKTKRNRGETFNNQIEKNKELANKTRNKFSRFDNIETLDYTPFNLEKITFEFEINVEDTSSILEIFNTIVLNKNIPFASTNNFYKILKGFKPPIEWVNLFDRSTSFRDRKKDINRETNIILKILEDKKIKNKDRYIDIIISMKDINTIKISTKYNKKFISTDKIIKNCRDILRTEKKPQNIKEVNVNGVYYMFEKINSDVMLDMILNNPIFSNLLSVNESSISTLSSVYIYFENSNLGKITLKLSPIKVSSKNIKSLLSSNIDEDKIKINKNIIRIRITECDNINKIENFQNLFSKLITLYKDNEADIIKIYEDYSCSLDDNEEEEEIKIKVSKKEEDDLYKIDPFIFDKKTKYTTSCGPFKRPKYLTDDEAEIKIQEGKSKNIIRFPKEEIEDISSPKYYICDKEPYIFPGLQKNKYKQTNELVPYLPCCFTIEQTDKPEYNDYYFTDEADKTSIATSIGSRTTKSKYIVENVKRPLDRKIYGSLPPNLKRLFLLGDQNNTYYREGMLDTKSSFLNCVMQALDTKKLSEIDDIRIPIILHNQREKLNTDIFAGYCRQEMFDYSMNEIKNKIKNKEEYLDPNLFIHLLELHFDCNIFLFSLKNNGEFIIPNNLQCYYKLKNNKRCIFVIENTNTKCGYPRCELIIKHNPVKSIHTSIFNSDDNISKLIFDTYGSYIKSYALNTQVSPINLNWPLEKLEITSQIFDAYGKTRIFNVNYKSKKISLFTSPIQPVKLDSNFELTEPINKTDIKTAKEILDIISAKNIQEITELNTRKLEGKINNVILHILIQDEIDFDSKIQYSAMLEYNMYKKLSRYIIEYVFWLFSKYLNENTIEPEYIAEKYDNIFYDFKDKYIQMNKDFEYKNIKKKFSLENSGIINNKKLVIKSEDTLKRLFYILRLKLIRNLDEILKYNDKIMIENYYLDITDFSFEYNQSILQGEKAFFRLLNETTRKIIYKKINFVKEEEEEYKKDEKKNKEDEDDEEEGEEEEDEEEGEEKIIIENLESTYFYVVKPYFFRNNIIDSKNIYIAQNIDSYLKGIKISMIWNRNKYNPGINVKINDDDNLNQNFTLYSYTSSNDIKTYNVEGERNNLNIKIIGYKVEDPEKKTLINFYTVLLPL